MGFLLIGIGLIGICIIALRIAKVNLQKTHHFTIAMLSCLICGYIAMGLIVCSFVSPIGEYKEGKILSTKELTSYELLKEECYYAISEEYITFFAVTEVISETGKKTEPQPMTQLKDNVEIIYEKNCTMPRVEEHLMKWENSGWTFAKAKDKTVYKIYIPE